MSTWSDVTAFLHLNYRVRVDGEVMTVDVPVAAGRSQPVSVLKVGAEIVAVVSIIGAAAEIDPAFLLRMSAKRMLGVAAGLTDLYYVGSRLALDGLSPEQLSWQIQAVGYEAYMYQRDLALSQ